MAEPLTPTSIEALIEGNVSGQVAVGNYNVQIHAEHGAVVHFIPPGQQPAPRLRPSPVLLRPRPVRGLVDRQEDAAAALAALGSCLPVEVYGPPGIGKSTLLRHLAHAAEAGSLADGVVHLSARQQPAADLLQALFDAFYECDGPFKPTATQVRHFLRDRKALVLLDDCELGREAAEELLDAGPACAFVLASPERCLWGEGRAIHLGALPQDDARLLFERELGRTLTAEESPAFENLYTRLDGQPLRLLQAAAQVREGRPVADAVPIEEGTARRTLAPLPEEEKRLLSALAAVGGGPVGAAHLGALADVPDPLAALNDLLERKLVQVHSPRYSLTGDLASLLGSIWDLSPWRERALAYFAAWAEAHRADPAALREEMDVLRRLLNWAAQAGHSHEVLRLERALDTACATGGRWGAWEQALERVRGAAGARGDRATEGWALHQLGTRLLCLDDKAGARQLLSQALAIRESLGDQDGAAVTRHNLGLLGPVPPPSGPSGERAPRSLPVLPWLAAVLLVFLVVVAGTWLGSRRFRSDHDAETPRTDSGEEETPATGTEAPPVTDMSIEETPSSSESDQPPDHGSAPPEVTDVLEPPPVETPEEPQDQGRPAMDLTPQGGLSFGDVEVGQSERREVTVTNSGNAPLTIDAISLGGERAEEFEIGRNCDGEVLDPGKACTFPVTFKPAAPGRRGLRLTVTDRTARIEQTLAIRGTGTEEAAQVPQGWCCAGGQVFQSSEAECESRRGRLYPRERMARVACLSGCCVDGKFEFGVPADECTQREGIPMTAVEALLRCKKPDEGWCCTPNGKPFPSTREECKRQDGLYFETEAEARQRCEPPG